ncbi:MAG: ATP-binding protein [Clostridiales bacterium]|nr:ATP-binding protein [Clostridiales bacterium]
MAFYNISNTSYSGKMNERTNTYNSLINKAEAVRIQNDNKPSAKEAELYQEAARVCGEIMAINNTQRNVYAQWQNRKDYCLETMERVAASINPPTETEKKEAPLTIDNNTISKSVSVPSKTESGFTTKNACKDVSAATIESWYKSMPRHGFDDVSGMEEVKDMLLNHVSSSGWSRLDEILGIPPFQSFFFYGSPGTGKTFIIEAFAHEMMQQGFKFIRLLGGDIHASLVGVAEKTVEIAFQEAIDNEPCIIFIDEIENVCVNRSLNNVEGHEKRLTVAFLEAYNLLKSSGKRVIFLGATNYPSMVDEAMLDRIQLIKIPLPDYDTRLKFFNRTFNVLKPAADFSFEDMAELTNNYSFRDLGRLADTIAIRIKSFARDEYAVVDTDGVIDEEATSKKAVDAILSGELAVTRELFTGVQTEMPPSDKTKINEELASFEERIKGINK